MLPPTGPSVGNWLAEPDPKKLAMSVRDAVEACFETYARTGFSRLWRKAFNYLYGGDYNSGKVAHELRVAGAHRDEIVTRQNQLPSMLDARNALLSQSDITFRAVAKLDDVDAVMAADVAQVFFEHLTKKCGFTAVLEDWRYSAMVYGEAYLWLNWNTDKQDLDARVVYPWRMARPVFCDPQDMRWCAVVNFEDKWDVAASWAADDPELYRRITRDVSSLPTFERNTLLSDRLTSQGDLCEVLYFYAAKTPSLPDGRMAIVVNEDVLFDGPLPFSRMPLLRLAEKTVAETTLGYAKTFDLLGLQQTLDALWSALNTRAQKGAKPYLAVQGGGKLLGVEQLEASNVLQLEAGSTISPVDFLQIPPAMLQLISTTVATMEQLIDLNAALRGRPDEILGKNAPASSLALIQQQAMSFGSVFQREARMRFEDAANLALEMYQSFAPPEKKLQVVGALDGYKVRELAARDLAGIGSVYVEAAPAIANTAAGRQQLVQDMMQLGFVVNPDQYLDVQRTGRLRSVSRFAEDQRTLADLQCAALSSLDALSLEDRQTLEQVGALTAGVGLDDAAAMELQARADAVVDAALQSLGCMPLLTDNHPYHIGQLTGVLVNAEARRDPVRVQLVTAKITRHMQLWAQLDPQLAQAMGIPPYQPPPPPPPPAPPAPEAAPPAAESEPGPLDTAG